MPVRVGRDVLVVRADERRDVRTVRRRVRTRLDPLDDRQPGAGAGASSARGSAAAITKRTDRPARATASRPRSSRRPSRASSMRAPARCGFGDHAGPEPTGTYGGEPVTRSETVHPTATPGRADRRGRTRTRSASPFISTVRRNEADADLLRFDADQRGASGPSWFNVDRPTEPIPHRDRAGRPRPAARRTPATR